MSIQLARSELISRIDDLSQRERKMIKLNTELTLKLAQSENRYKQLKHNIKLALKGC